MPQVLTPPPPQLDHEQMAAYEMPMPEVGQQVEYYLGAQKSRNKRLCYVVETRMQDIRVASIDQREQVTDEWVCYHADPRLKSSPYIAKRGCWGFLQRDLDRQELEFEIKQLLGAGIPKLLERLDKQDRAIHSLKCETGKLRNKLKLSAAELAEIEQAGEELAEVEQE